MFENNFTVNKVALLIFRSEFDQYSEYSYFEALLLNFYFEVLEQIDVTALPHIFLTHL